MKRGLQKEVYNYFHGKTDRTDAEQALFKKLEFEMGYFQVTAAHRDDLRFKGFDVSNVSDGDMKLLARKMADDYCEQLFWPSMEIIAEVSVKIPKTSEPFCPKCESYLYDYDIASGTYSCRDCGQTWTDNYVLVKHPDDTTYFEEEEIGYPSYASEDNGARYVTHYEYILQYQKEPPQNSFFQPVSWPDSQSYFELPDNLRELCENIESGKAFDDFGSSALWVPLCLLNHH